MVPVTSAPAASAPDTPPRRLDGSMSLLNDMMTNTLDEAYADRAARKAAGGPGSGATTAPEGRGGVLRRGTALLTLLAVGVVTGTAVAQVRARQEANSGVRAELVAQVQERAQESQRLSATAEQLRLEVAATQNEVLGADAAGRAAAQRLVTLGLASATLPVEGPGLVVTLDDAPAEAAREDPLRGGTPVDGRVQDRDLQDLVNGLWAAGAEAVSVNDIRLTALTAIRSAGDTVLVDFQLLSPPYVVRAVGDPAALELGLLDGPTGRRLSTYVLNYGLRLEVRRAESLSLPGAGAPDLHAVEPAEERP
jgi:uncharacterized protein YlxW (UPF0749 family)